jgi:signal transduction histidine kinase
MRSIRWSLLLYFLLALAVAMGAVSVLVYQRMREAVSDKERAAARLLREQYDAQKVEERKKLDAKLEAKARTLVSLARIQSNSSRVLAGRSTGFDGHSLDWRIIDSVRGGHVSTALAPTLSNQLSGGLLDAVATAYFLPELQFNEEELYRDKGDDPAIEYFQMDSNFWHTSWRSRSLGDLSFPVDPAVFNNVPRYRGQLGAMLATQNGNPLTALIALTLNPEEDSAHPLLEPEWTDRELEPGHTVRCVSLKAPIWSGSVRVSPLPGWWTPPRIPARPGTGGTNGRTDRPAAPRQPDRPQFFIYVQCASDTSDRDLQLARLDARRNEDLDTLREESRASLANLRRHLWLICLATFFTTAIGGYLLVLIGLYPLKRVSEAVSRVSPRDFKLPLSDRPLPVELRPIVERLNITLELLKQAFAREKQAVADMSHDLRTPVAALLASTEVALRKPRSAQQYRDTLEDCHSTGKQMNRLVERLLALARIDAGVDRVHTSDFDAADLAEECVNLVRPLAVERQLDLQLHRNGPMSVHSDPDKVREVLTNLLHNAIQYNRPQGSVSLTVEQSDGRVQFDVRDTGIGIAPAARERIFERFYREDPSRHGDDLTDFGSGNGDGMHSGLGLAIVKGYVDLLGGSIRVESTVGKGSTFHVEIPTGSLKPIDVPPMTCEQPTKRSA